MSLSDGWRRDSAAGKTVMSARGGSRLHVHLVDGKIRSTSRGGEIELRDGWVYGSDEYSGGWTVPERSITSIGEA